jgi:xanthine dehydrogenase YagS FAD-binding subunit
MSPFSLIDAYSAFEAVALLQAHGPHAQAMAAGGDLLGLLKEGLKGPALPLPRVVINLATAEDLRRVERTAEGWSLGAMVTLSTLASTSGMPSMLAEAIDHIASPQLRSRTTLGGNLLQRPRCLYFRHPDETCFKKGGVGCPAVGGPIEAYPGALTPGACSAGHPSDLAPVLMALQASAELCGPSGVRHVLLADLFADAAARADTEAAIGRDEVLVRLHVPHATLTQAFEKVASRDANEFTTASAAAAGAVQGSSWQVLRIAIAGVGPGPLLLSTDLFVDQPVAAHTDRELSAALLPAPTCAPFNSRLPAARLAVERVLQRVRTGTPPSASCNGR